MEGASWPSHSSRRALALVIDSLNDVQTCLDVLEKLDKGVVATEELLRVSLSRFLSALRDSVAPSGVR